MADGRPFHGYNARIQVGTNIISGANKWNLTKSVSTVEVTEFEDAWVRNLAGQKAANGSISAWQYADKRILMDLPGTEEALWIYPDAGDLTNYWYGVPLFTNYGSGGSTTEAVSASIDFVVGSDGNGMTAYGFA